MKLSKTQLHKTGQYGGFLGRLLEPFLKTRQFLMKHLLKSLSKSVLAPLGSTAAAPTTDTAIHKKTFDSGRLLGINMANL